MSKKVPEAKKIDYSVNLTNQPISIYTRGLGGHRKSYLDLVSKLFSGHQVNKWQACITQKPLLYLMVEDNFGLYALTGLIRALFRKRTVGLLFRPLPALNGKKYRFRLKRSILKVLKKLKSINTISIIPFSCHQPIATICDAWIYDPQLWDMSNSDHEQYENQIIESKIKDASGLWNDSTKLAKRIQDTADGRLVLISLGLQSRDKGIDVLTKAADMHALDSWLIVAAGRFDESASQMRSKLAERGHLVIDRYLSDEEIIAAYATADATWCLYHPRYDQASGILGRSIQFGIPPIVRRGSIGHILCKSDNIPHICADGAGDLNVALGSLPRKFKDFGLTMADKYRDHSVKVLMSALAVESIRKE